MFLKAGLGFYFSLHLQLLFCQFLQLILCLVVTDEGQKGSLTLEITFGYSELKSIRFCYRAYLVKLAKAADNYLKAI